MSGALGARVLLGAAGVALGAWGAWLLLPQVTVELLLWLGGGVVLHDFVIAPLVGASGFVVKRPSVGVGLVTTGIITLLAVPLLWRKHSGPVNPGLHDRDYLTSVAVVLGLIWAAVALYEVAAHLQQRRRAHEEHDVPHEVQRRGGAAEVGQHAGSTRSAHGSGEVAGRTTRQDLGQRLDGPEQGTHAPQQVLGHDRPHQPETDGQRGSLGDDAEEHTEPRPHGGDQQ